MNSTKDQDTIPSKTLPSILKAILSSLNRFILAPTSKNLESLSDNLTQYTQMWISFSSDGEDIPDTNQFKLDAGREYEPYLQKDNLHSIDESMDILIRILNIDPDHLGSLNLSRRQIADITHLFRGIKTFKPLTKKQQINRALFRSTKILFRIKKHAESLSPSMEIERKRQGGVTFTGQRVFIPKSIINPIFPEIQKKILLQNEINLDYFSFKFRASRAALTKTEKPVNRRWLCEDYSNNKTGVPGVPWSEYRHEIEEILSQKIIGDSSYDDLRLQNSSENLFHIFPNGSEGAEQFFNEVTVPAERGYIRNLKGIKVAVFQSDYFKSASQLIDHNLFKAPTWRDVCIFNDSFITLRSFTNDLSHTPCKKIESQEWVLCNNMPEYSIQALRFFKKILDKDLLERIELMLKDKMSSRDIARRVHISEDKLVRIMQRHR